MRDVALAALDRAHSRISPSSFARAEACTMSLVGIEGLEPEESGPHALAGSAAHALGERCLREGLDMFELAEVEAVPVEDRGVLVPVAVDDQMRETVQIYLDAVRSRAGGRRLEIEQTLHLDFAEQYLGEPIWGHADALVREPPFLVVDLKNGFGFVPADAVQLGLYLLMVAVEIAPGLGGEGLAGTTVVVQPNAPSEPVRSHDWTWADLRNLRDRVIHTLRRVKRRDWTYQDGPHCRFCIKRGWCPHLAAVARDAALAMVAPTPEMVASGEVTAQTIADWLAVTERLDAWAKAVQNAALDYSIHGGVIPGWKLVRKGSKRRWRLADEPAAAAALQDVLQIDPWQKKLITPAEAERRLPAARKREVDQLAEKPRGELALARDDDPHERVDVGLSLKAALRSSVAAGFIEQAQRLAKSNNTE